MKIKVTTTPDDVIGVLSGFDRLRQMATLRPVYQPSLTMRYLIRTRVLLGDFAAFASGWTELVCMAAQPLAERTGRPLSYLHGSAERKELVARVLARRQGLTQGLIDVWSVREPCLTYFLRRDREQNKLVLSPAQITPGPRAIGTGIGWLGSGGHLRQNTERPAAGEKCG